MESSTPRRIFGPADASTSTGETQSRLRNFRYSLPNLPKMGSPSFASRWRNRKVTLGQNDTEPSLTTPTIAPIPTAFEPKDEAGEPSSTPLPTLSMIVLSITMLGEFLSANVSTPFLLFMVRGFDETSDEADVAFWTGILVAAFFLTQFMTSLLWATVANKHGARIVLTVSLLGSSLTCMIFGTSTTLKQALVIRLLQGIFAGAVGVARGAVATVTDPSNEGRAYAILGFCWGFGGVAGAIIGGTFETPAAKWAGLGERVPLLVTYPYLLPCNIAAVITLTGSVLSLFLSRDAGPRYGAIFLAEKELDHQDSAIAEEDGTPITIDTPPAVSGPLGALRKKVSGYFGQATNEGNPVSPTSPGPSVPLSVAPSSNRPHRIDGSAYGYGGSNHFRSRLSSAATAARRGSLASTMRNKYADNAELSQSVPEVAEMNFAQRLLMANENAVTNIADLWVAAAMNVDTNENPFESDSEDDDGNDHGGLIDESTLPVINGTNDEDADGRHSRPTTGGFRTRLATNDRYSASPRRTSAHRFSTVDRERRESGAVGDLEAARRMSTNVPAIFNHVGVRTPPAVLDAQMQQFLQYSAANSPMPDNNVNMLEPILEGQRIIIPESTSTTLEAEKPVSLASQLPIMIILQYGLLALHSTTHDQVFMSYLVSPYEAGGLNLKAGHFAQLIALMCLAQIVYQFYLYPNLGPPRGKFSHLAMFRLGSLLFIPSYITVTLYRVFASSSDDENFVLMTALAISTAVRYAGNTFAYTACSILLNYMTPPQAIGFANGIAQSIVSLARCFGPVLGGWLWATTTQGNPSGFYQGFFIVSAACAFAVALSFTIR